MAGVTFRQRLGGLPVSVVLAATSLVAAALEWANTPPTSNSSLPALAVFIAFLAARRRDLDDIAATVLAVSVATVLLAGAAGQRAGVVEAIGAVVLVIVAWLRYDRHATRRGRPSVHRSASSS